jgi:hypothetical protein
LIGLVGQEDSGPSRLDPPTARNSLQDLEERGLALANDQCIGAFEQPPDQAPIAQVLEVVGDLRPTEHDRRLRACIPDAAEHPNREGKLADVVHR